MAAWRVRLNGETVATYLSAEKARQHCEELRRLMPAANVVMLWL
jgi:hypothetical protein